MVPERAHVIGGRREAEKKGWGVCKQPANFSMWQHPKIFFSACREYWVGRMVGRIEGGLVVCEIILPGLIACQCVRVGCFGGIA